MSELIPRDEEEAGGCLEEDGGCDGEKQPCGNAFGAATSRKEKRKAAKKMKRKQLRMEAAVREREEEEARMNDPEELKRMEEAEREEEERMERERREFEERERAWAEAMERKRKEKEREEEEEERRRKALEESQVGDTNELTDEEGDWEYVEEGPAEIIWQGNEIIVKKKRVRVPKKGSELQKLKEDADRPTSNPLPPQSEAFSDHQNSSLLSAQQILENVSQQVPNFGTEQDKAHCPFHLKTGACRFGQRCSRVHFYPDKSCTLLIRNMYNGPGLAWEQDEGLEHTDEEVERCYEEFYEDVHTEFLKFGEVVNFKVCRNGSFHLRGNVYVHYKSLDSAVLAYNSISGRFFAGKQVNCEYVNVTRWKVAICGEYMRSRYKTCSHGTACNFIHCFRNPGGDYEWADWDKPPPRYWVRKMSFLFGYSEEHHFEGRNTLESPWLSRKPTPMLDLDSESRHQSRRSHSRGDRYDHYRRSCGGENGIATSRSPEEELDTYHKKRRKHSDGDRNNEENPHRSSRRSDYDSGGDHISSERETRKHHKARSSRHHKVSEPSCEYGDTKRRASRADSDRDRSDTDEDREEYSGRSHRIYKSHKKVEREDSRDRTDGNDSPVRKHRRRKSQSPWSGARSSSDQTVSLNDRWDPRANNSTR